jgi:hypothetical protein
MNDFAEKMTIDNFLFMLSKSKLMSYKIHPAMLDQLERVNRDTIIALTKLKEPTLKDFVLERAKKRRSQSIATILSCLEQKDLSSIHKDDLVINLVGACLRGECTVDEIGTAMMQYMSIERFNKIYADSETATFDFVDIFANIEKMSNYEIDKFNFETQETLNIYKQMVLSQYPQLNKMIYVTDNVEESNNERVFKDYEKLNEIVKVVDGSTIEDMSQVFSICDVFIVDTDTNSLAWLIPPFHVLSQHILSKSESKSACVLPMPVIGAYDMQFIAALSYPESNHWLDDKIFRFRPVTFPCNFDIVIKKFFYGATVDEDNRSLRYISPEGFKDFTKVHDVSCGTFQVLMHDLTHIVGYFEFAGAIIGAKIIRTLNNMLKNKKLSYEFKEAIQRLYTGLLDEGVNYVITFVDVECICCEYKDQIIHQVLFNLEERDLQAFKNCLIKSNRLSPEYIDAAMQHIYEMKMQAQSIALQELKSAARSNIVHNALNPNAMMLFSSREVLHKHMDVIDEVKKNEIKLVSFRARNL